MRMTGVLLIGVGLGLILFFPAKGSLICRPEPPGCTIERGSIAMPETVTLSTRRILQAQVQTIDTEDGPASRAVFILDNHTVEPWTSHHTNSGDFNAWLTRVRTWLAQPAGVLRLQVGQPWLLWVMGGPCLLLGLLFSLRRRR